ncbi:condensation domain-containing protein [Amycolatopsis sp. OK19-0408]|uniref:Condensation domain-containing protein n=1 Tax=Amycolatopsis iheyensis TaxID=2945988 RepID=A0A9X2SMB2_9PSEU|nr:condensation domain-containing protein [Amycolatopsis iheyensis]MCR6485756.1 condensation domain-containing protein [Amycolatopsis iheyensis]
MSRAAVARIWAEVLRVPEPGAHDDFFVLGGDSIAATRLMARLRAELRIDLPATAVFGSPVLGELAELVAGADVLPPAAPPRTDPAELSAAQRRQWFLELFSEGAPSYHIPLVLRIRGPLDTTALRAAVRDLAARHRILRTRYPDRDGEPYAVTDDAGGFAVGMARVPPDEAGAWVRARVRAPFELATGPVFRAAIGRTGRADHVLAMTVHHIAADGWSRRILLDELGELYAFHRGLGPAPAAAPPQYADVPQRPPTEADVTWWAEELRGAPDRTTFPAARPRPAVLTDDGATIPFDLGADLSAAVRALARSCRTTTYTVLMTALQVLLSQETGETDVVVATSVAGRDDAAAEPVVGCFINTVAIRADHSGDPVVTELVGRVRAATMGALDHAHVSFDRVVEAADVRRDPAYRPLFQVMLTVHNEPVPDPALAGLEVTWLDVDTGGAKCDTFFAVTDDGGPLTGALTYRTQLYDHSDAVRLAGRFRAVLAAVATRSGRRVSELGTAQPEGTPDD